MGGYTLEELLGSEPVSKVEKKKPGLIAKIVGAPFRLVLGIVKLPVTIVSRLVGGVAKALREVVTLPVRLVRAVLSPWKKS